MSIVIGGVLVFVLIAVLVSTFLHKVEKEAEISDTMRLGVSVVKNAVFLTAASALPMFAVTGQITVSGGELVSLQAGVLVYLHLSTRVS